MSDEILSRLRPSGPQGAERIHASMSRLDDSPTRSAKTLTSHVDIDSPSSCWLIHPISAMTGGHPVKLSARNPRA
jgi:hypothetical protein